MPPVAPYVYDAAIIRPYDGDTFVARLRLAPWNIEQVSRIRLAGLNCPELPTPAGKVAADYTARWLQVAANGGLWPLVLSCPGLDNYGRILCTVWRSVDGSCLNDDLISSGNAVVVKSIVLAQEAW